MIKVGQDLLGRVPFRDGTIPKKDRPYLVVSVTAGFVGLVVVSTVHKKEHKLLMQTNREINNYNPPFLQRSFIKLDSLVYIPISEASKLRVLQKGTCLRQDELDPILEGVKLYSK